eukprot:symbB.v1.2.035000.t1/scaffold4623.1/size37307/3
MGIVWHCVCQCMLYEKHPFVPRMTMALNGYRLCHIGQTLVFPFSPSEVKMALVPRWTTWSWRGRKADLPQHRWKVMAGLYPWLVLAAAMLGLMLLSYIIYHYFVDPEKSYSLAMVTVILSLTIGILCTLIIPVDIYVISEGDITSESLHVTISQDHVRDAYLILFSSLLFIAFFLVPYAYFYGEEKPSARDDPFLEKSQCWNAMRSTGFFVAFVVALLILSLNFRPGHKESLDRALQSEESAVRWLNDLLDVQHGGLNAISFAIACLTLAGVLGWAMYTAYGLAAMPFDWIRQGAAGRFRL